LTDWIDVVGWLETEDPVAFVRAALAPGDRDRPIQVAISDHTRAVFLLRLQAALPRARFSLVSEVLAPMRRVKDDGELCILREAQDRAVQALQQLVELPFAGRTERQVAADLRRFCEAQGLEEGFGAQVGAGPDGAQAHLPPSDRAIRRGEPVMIDFWAAYQGYYCDCSRTLHVGPPSAEFQEVFAIMREANHAALAAVRPGVRCQSIDRAARQVIAAAGYEEHFFHRLGLRRYRHRDPRGAIHGGGKRDAPGTGDDLHQRAGHLSPRPVRLPYRGRRRRHPVEPGHGGKRRGLAHGLYPRHRRGRVSVWAVRWVA